MVSLATASIVLLCTLLRSTTCIQVGGAGYSYIFSAPGYGSSDEIRTATNQGLESFTISLYQRNLIPCVESNGFTTGYQGAVLSYYGVGSGKVSAWDWAFDGNLASTNEIPKDFIFRLADYNNGVYVSLFNTSFILSTTDTVPTPFYNNMLDGETWFQSFLTWNLTAGVISLHGFVKNVDGTESHSSYTTSLAVTRPLPRGVWRLGQTSNFDPNLGNEIDNFCVYNTALSYEEILIVRQRGCDALPEHLTTYYTFDDDRRTLPNIYNAADGVYSGISSDVLMPQDTCPIETMLSTRTMYQAVSTAPVNNGHVVVLAAFDSIERQKVCLTPGTHDYCYTQADGLNGYPTNINVTSGLVTFWVTAHNISINDGTSIDTFAAHSLQKLTLRAWTFNRGVSKNMTVAILKSSPPIVASNTLSLVEGSVYVLYLPPTLMSIKNPDGSYGNLTATITSFSSNITDLEGLKVYDCPACLGTSASITDNQAFRASLNSSDSISVLTRLPYVVKDKLRRVILVANKNPLLAEVASYNLTYQLFTGREYSNSAITHITVTCTNMAPVAVGFDLHFDEDAAMQLIQLSDYAFDRENNFILYSILSLPTHAKLFQVTAANGTGSLSVGAQITTASHSLTFSQWVSYHTIGDAIGCWEDDECVAAISGPPDLWPHACDCPNAWQPNADSYLHTWVEVYFDVPVYARDVTVYMTWGPGSIVSIQAKPYDTGTFGADWVTVYTGPTTLDFYCAGSSISAPCAGRLRYDLWGTIFPTNHLRFAMELNHVSQWVAIDAISLEGSIMQDASIIQDFHGRFFMQSNQFFNGHDSFVYSVTDLSYFMQWQNLAVQNSSAGTISLDVKLVNREPIPFPTADNTGVVIVLPQNSTFIPELGGFDVHGNEVHVEILTLPTNGDLYWANKFTGELASVVGQKIVSASNQYYFVPHPCYWLETASSTVTFKLSNVGGNGTVIMTALSDLTIQVPCTQESLVYEPSTPVIPLVAVIIIAVFSYAFQIFVLFVVYKFRESVLVRSIKQKFCYILVLANALGTTGTIALVFEATEISCPIQIILVGISFALNMGTLLATATRISYLFGNPDNLRKLQFQDSKVIQIISLVVGTEIVILIVGAMLGSYGTPVYSLEQLSATSASHLVAVCRLNNSFVLFQMTFAALTTGYTIYLSWKVLDTPSSFNESKHLFNTSLIHVVIGVIVMPTSYFISNNSEAASFLLGAGFGLGYLLIMISMFLPKVILIYYGLHDNEDLLLQRNISSTDKKGSISVHRHKTRAAGDRTGGTKGDAMEGSLSSNHETMHASNQIAPEPAGREGSDLMFCTMCALSDLQALELYHKVHEVSEGHRLRVKEALEQRALKRTAQRKITQPKSHGTENGEEVRHGTAAAGGANT